jgi:hypothetical protein
MAKFFITFVAICALIMTSEAGFVSRKLQQVSGSKLARLMDRRVGWAAACVH